MNSEKQAQEIVAALSDAKGEDIKVYDVRGKSGITDFFVVATGCNYRNAFYDRLINFNNYPILRI